MSAKKILFATDFSENSVRAGEWVLDYSKEVGAEIVILHVIDSWAGIPAYTQGVPIDVQHMIRSMEESTKAELERVAKDFEAKGVKVATCYSTGVPAEEIVQTAIDEDADLIAMGTHGWGAAAHMLLGSVAEKVLRSAKCPVLVARPVT